VKSAKPGKTTSAVELQHISAHGSWLFVESTARVLLAVQRVSVV
jgi:hypothetical protein